MKKYLIKGLLLFVVGALTASCADKDVDYVPLDQQKATAYADAFKELIGGQVAPNHDWGFKKTSIIEEPAAARARTRAVDVNGNMWIDRPEVTEQERADVAAYVNYTRYQMDHLNPAHRYYTEFPRNIENYFVSHVYKGSDHYTDADGNGDILGSGHMDNLHIKESSVGTLDRPTGALSETGWYHVNNFNNGNNTDWGGNTLVVSSGTLDFAYASSSDSKYHNRWIVVNGADIKPEYAGYYYVCFDFEAYYTDPTNATTTFQLDFQFKRSETQTDNVSRNVERSGFFKSADAIIGDGFTTYDYDGNIINVTPDMISNIRVINGNQYVAPNDVYTDWIIRLVEAQPGGGNNSTSNTRKDLIERSRLVAQGRVFCEDLGTDAARMLTSDIDFNDAVFDAKIWRKGQFEVEYLNGTYNSESDYLEGIYTNGINQTTGIDYNFTTQDVIVNGKFKYVAEICILAAGGTVPLKIGGNNGFEIHEKFGEGNGRTIGHTTIINTMGEPSKDQFKALVNSEKCNAVTTEVDITDLVKAELQELKNDTKISLDIIPIEVMWTSDNHQAVGVLTAETEDDIYNAPQKLCVPIGTPWVYERIPITSAYKDFASYATTKSPDFWEGNNKNTSLLYPSDPVGMTPEENVTNSISSNPTRDVVVEEGPTITTTEVETILWQGSNTYKNEEGGNNGTTENLNLVRHDFNVGDWVRIYGTATDANQAIVELKNELWTTILKFDPANFDGYIEMQIGEDFVNGLQTNVMHSWGRYCTITKICKVVKTSSTN